MWHKPYLFKINPDGLICKCVVGDEERSIMWHVHNLVYGGRHSEERTATKVLESGF